ncbi:MAG: DUF616 domain-containing protein [Lachnospiraceae bacterium]|nr:DUF616 domain-containing protein [Lachnospiraceae bacterium]
MDQYSLQQIYDKIANHIVKLVEKINNNQIDVKSLSLYDLNDLINNSISSSSGYFDPMPSFQQSINNTFSLFEIASQSGNRDMCSNLLIIILSQLESFINLELSWAGTLEYNQLINRHDIYTRHQWEKHINKLLPHTNRFTGSGVVYTAITGGYDNLAEPEYVNDKMDYICFTDNEKITSDVWQIRIIENPDNLDPIRLARKHKILCTNYLGEYDFSIWVDGKIQICGDLSEIVDRYHLDSPILCMPHYERDCIYDEAEKCLSEGKGISKDIEKQVQKYRDENYPEHNGLIDSCVLFRLHSDSLLKSTMDTWWNEVLNESTRDQLSFNYACNKTGLVYDLCNFSIYNNPYFSVVNHSK